MSELLEEGCFVHDLLFLQLFLPLSLSAPLLLSLLPVLLLAYLLFAQKLLPSGLIESIEPTGGRVVIVAVGGD